MVLYPDTYDTCDLDYDSCHCKRNKGIGSELMRHVKQWAQEHNLQLLIVSPSDASIPFYERAGFKQLNIILVKDLT